MLEKGEERLIEAVQNGTIPLTIALEIARAKHDDENLGDMLEEAYRTGQLKGHQITDAKRLIETCREKGPKTGGDRPKLPNSAHSLVKTYPSAQLAAEGRSRASAAASSGPGAETPLCL